MAGFSTAFPYSFKAELPQALHDFTQTTGHVFKVALGIGSPTGTYNASTVNYSELVSNSDEVPNGSGYTTGGFAWTAGQNITPQVSAGVAFWSWSVNPSWAAATFDTSGCLIYNSDSGNRVVYVGSFGGVQSLTAATLTLALPTNGAGTSIINIG